MAMLSTVWDVPVREGWFVARGEVFSHCVTGEFVGHFSIGKRNSGLIFQRRTRVCNRPVPIQGKSDILASNARPSRKPRLEWLWRQQRHCAPSATPRFPSKASDSTYSL